MARLDLKKRGKKVPELLIEDSRGQAGEAVSAYRKLQSSHSVSAVFTWGSGVALALSPIVNRDETVQMGLATASEEYSTPDDFNFRNYPKASQEAEFLAKMVVRHFKVKEIAIVHTENDYGTSTADFFQRAFQKLGGKVIIKTELAPGNTDNRTQVLSVRKTEPKLVFLAVYPVEGAAFLKQARQLGLIAPMIASVALFGSYEFLEMVGPAANGVTLAAAMPEIEKRTEFARNYKKLFGEEFGPQHFYSARAYDAFLAVAAALEKCAERPEDGQCLRSNLSSMDAQTGIGGTIEFDENGDITPTFSAYVIKDGRYGPIH